MPDTLLILEDEALLGKELLRRYQRAGWDVALATDIQTARELLLVRRLDPLLVLADMSLPDGSALDLLEQARAKGHSAEWIFLTAFGTVPDSVRALRLGAHDFLEKPCELERLDVVVTGATRSARAQRRLKDQAAAESRLFAPASFLGRSAAARQARELLGRLAGLPFSALVLTGETGTGKGLTARILHHTGQRSEGPMVEVNCGALPKDLLESELFGHEAGAFTGAKGRHRGLLERADGGTLFLDEISEMPVELQVKLLSAIEGHEFRRVGGEREIAVNVQIIAASNRDLEARVQAGQFRADLYHRLRVFHIELPPLRKRKEDIEDLAPHFVLEYNTKANKHVQHIPGEAWAAFMRHDWPGNVRELRNVIERCVLFAEDTELPTQWLDLSAALPMPASGSAEDASSVRLAVDGSQTLEQIERVVIEAALRRTAGNVVAAARLLGTTRETLRYRVQKHGLTPAAPEGET